MNRTKFHFDKARNQCECEQPPVLQPEGTLVDVGGTSTANYGEEFNGEQVSSGKGKQSTKMVENRE